MTPEQMEAQREAAEQRAQENRQEAHDEVINENTSKVADYQAANEKAAFTTEFTHHDLKAIKAMVEDGARVNGVDGIADAWDQVQDRLVGGKSDSGGGAYGDLERAVNNVLEHWEGDSANQFKAQAEKLLRQIKNSASHCGTVSEVLRAAAHDYRDIHDKVTAIEEPGWFDNTMDFLGDLGERDENITEEAIRNRDIPKDLLAKADEGFIGAEKEAQLKAASHMEILARRYVTYSDRLRSSRPVDPPPEDSIPPSEPGVPMPGPIPVPAGSASKPRTAGPSMQANGLPGGSSAPVTTAPRDVGISGGLPSAQTKIDGLPAGLTGSGTDALSGNASLRGGGLGGGVGTSGGAGATGGLAGGGMLGGVAAAGGAAGRGVGGRAGMGGMGAGAGAGAGKGGAAAGGRGPLARAKGGVLGAPKGISGGTPATQGGTGLGKGRGGAGSGGARGVGGMLGGARGNSQRPGDEGREQGNRPDYLVEDEETWAPEDTRSVPKSIE